MAQADDAPKIGIIMGSRSDWETMQAVRDTLVELGIACEVRVVSAHRMPDEMFDYAANAKRRGLLAIVAGAGGAAHLPGMTAAKTPLPVIGVPVQSKALHGIDSLLSIAQMPPGVPVATMAIGGAVNAALFAARIVALSDSAVGDRLASYVARMHADAAASSPE
ncbi:MAG TPA: 5-(carboxyamino)imidazole ribonucleotide mutase [Candidatus Tumulicola sp.]|nr:5-(carboxyamino)imidazole ribonucleotide mutase [Candidatus Tumulicola sp.]